MIDSSLQLAPLPSDTAHATKAVFNLTNAYLIIGDQADHWLRDIALPDRSPAPDQSGANRVRLALITLFQFAEDLPDRPAADALRTRMEWKYALHLPLNGLRFDYALLREYRQRLRQYPNEQLPLQRLIEQTASIGLLPLTERESVASPEVLLGVGNLNRIEDLREALQAALVTLAASHPDWLRRTVMPHWYGRYTQPAQRARLPHARSEQETFAKAIGEDAAYLLATIDDAANDNISNLTEIRLLRQIWQQQFIINHGLIQWQSLRPDPPVT